MEKVQLAEVNPQRYLPDLAMTQINMGIFYQDSKPNKEWSIQLVEEALTNLVPFHQIPYIQKYVRGALAVLTDWGVDAEAYWKEKTATHKD